MLGSILYLVLLTLMASALAATHSLLQAFLPRLVSTMLGSYLVSYLVVDVLLKWSDTEKLKDEVDLLQDTLVSAGKKSKEQVPLLVERLEAKITRLKLVVNWFRKDNERLILLIARRGWPGDREPVRYIRSESLCDLKTCFVPDLDLKEGVISEPAWPAGTSPGRPSAAPLACRCCDQTCGSPASRPRGPPWPA